VIDIPPRQLDGVTDWLVLIASACIRTDGAALSEIHDADYAHERSKSDVLCSLTAHMKVIVCED
jgi:hypothetical protein